MARPLRVAIVGRRFGRDVHAPAFASDPRCEVVAVVGRDGWREATASGSVDVISIAVPPSAQTPIVMAAAAAGKHVFCEKPLAQGLEEAVEALKAVERAGVVHGVDFLFPEVEAWRQARARLEAGTIGPVRHFAYTWRIETRASRLNADSWKGRPEEGGGALGNFASHVFHNIEWLLGPVVAMSGFTLPDGTRTGRAVDGLVRLSSGATGTVSISTDAFLGAGHLLEIFGEEGTLRLENAAADHVAGFTLSEGSRSSGGLTPVVSASRSEGDGRVAPVASLVRRFLDAILDGTPMVPNLTHAARVQALLALAQRHGNLLLAVPASFLEPA